MDLKQLALEEEYRFILSQICQIRFTLEEIDTTNLDIHTLIEKVENLYQNVNRFYYDL